MTDKDWLQDVDQTEPLDGSEADSVKFEILNYPADTTLSGYKDMWEKEQIHVPEFQRKYVWDQVRASRLIESFLLGLPVPGVFLYKERDKAQHTVIDGNQRINTIVSFFKEIFRDKKFVLKGVDSQWEGKSFSDLSEQDQFKLSTSVLRATIIQQLNPTDNSSVYYIFERLNTGGVNLNAMEVRMCLAEGSFTKLLKKLNVDQNWRKLVHKPEDPRLRDMELILRVFSLGEKVNEYEKPMKKFLNSYLNEKKGLAEQEIEAKKQEFEKAVSLAVTLSDKPFFVKERLNYGVLDSVLVGLMGTNITSADVLKARYEDLLKDNDFQQSITKNTSDRKEVLLRINKAKQIFTQ